MGAAAGASVGGSVLGGIGSAVGGGTRSYAAPQANLGGLASYRAPAASQTQYQSQVPQLSPYFQQSAPTTVGVAPTMMGLTYGQGLEAAQQQYGLGIDPSLYNSPYSRYGMNTVNPTYLR
jgi:hypothetical protein